MSMGRRIRECRIKNGFTQEYLANQLCISRQSVSKWEKDISKPDMENLVALSEILNVNIEFIATGKQDIAVEKQVQDRRIPKTLYLLGILLFVAFLSITCVGFFSGEYTNMVTIYGVGVWFLWYGKSAAGISLAVCGAFCFVLSILLLILGYNSSKQ